MEFPELTKYQKATFAGGCFWCMEPPFEKLAGVKEVISGYTGGTVPYPDYEGVCSGKTGHYEAVRVIYDPAVISYEQLLDGRSIPPIPADNSPIAAVSTGPLFSFTMKTKRL